MAAGQNEGGGAPNTGPSDDERFAQPRWVILLEATPSIEGSLIDRETADALLTAMGGETAALHRPNRVAVQVSVSADDMPEALAAVLFRWRRAAAQVGLQDWQVVRGEVLTPQEFEQDLQSN